jgi:hypothetical protein
MSLENEKKANEIKTLEAKNGLRQRYLNHYRENYNLSQYAFSEAIARDERKIIRLKSQIKST